VLFCEKGVSERLRPLVSERAYASISFTNQRSVTNPKREAEH
jgi:hypothetical protein